MEKGLTYIYLLFFHTVQMTCHELNKAIEAVYKERWIEVRIRNGVWDPRTKVSKHRLEKVNLGIGCHLFGNLFPVELVPLYFSLARFPHPSRSWICIHFHSTDAAFTCTHVIYLFVCSSVQFHLVFICSRFVFLRFHDFFIIRGMHDIWNQLMRFRAQDEATKKGNEMAFGGSNKINLL